ncbi:MAG TPA: AAA family ATPase [Baekduia sp.]|nr:AAA family ATPase [Baekduia sp.]
MQLVERDAEIAAAAGAVRDAAAGRGRVLILRGPAGIGKTALLDRVCADAAAAGARVLRARGDDVERDLDFGVARQLLVPTLGRGLETPAEGPAAAGAAALGHAPSPAGGLSPGTAAHGLGWLVAELAADAPLVLAVDDAQWADSSSLTWLAYLARRLGDLAVLLALGWRPGDEAGDGVLERVAAGTGVVLLSPASLTLDGVRALTGAAGDELVTLHEATGGNPFLVSELRRAGSDPAAGAAVRSSVQRRLDRLGDAAVALARAVAVLGDGTDVGAASALARLELDQAAEAADALADADILARGPSLRFVHPLVREAVGAAIGDQRRAVLHRQAAQLLGERGASAGHVAAHLRRAPPAADPRAADVLAGAGRAAVGRGALQEGIALLRRAAAEPPPADARAGVLADLGVALGHAEEDEAADVLREAIALDDDPRRRVRSRVALARVLTRRDPTASIAELEVAVEEADRVAPDAGLGLRGTLLAHRLAQEGGAAGLPPGVPEDGRTLAGRTPGERALLAALAYADALAGRGTAATCGDLAERAMGAGRLVDDLGVEAPEAVFVVLAALATERLESARVFGEAWLDRARRRGSPIGFAFASVALTDVLLRAGELAAAESHAHDGVQAVPAALGPSPSTVRPGAHIRVLAERGRFDEAQAALATSVSDGRAPGATVLAAEAHLRRLEARWEEAAAAALAAGRRLAARGTPSPALAWRAEAAMALAALGRRDEALALAGEQRTVAEGWGSTRGRGLALHAQGLATGGQEGVALLREAVAVLDRSPLRLDVLHARVDLGAAMRRLKERAAARDVLREALDAAARAGTTVLEARARAELAATGARPRRALLRGTASLTASERRVALLAAEGRTNAEIAQALFVTRKTVETHLGAVFRKLDITSRQDIASALGADLGVAP